MIRNLAVWTLFLGLVVGMPMAGCGDDDATVDPVCGDGVCEGSETESSCPEDCGLCPNLCGDDVCSPTETCEQCTVDCGTCPDCGEEIEGQFGQCWNCDAIRDADEPEPGT